ncbi:zinc transporter [Azospirillaceae bacterium]
MNTPNVAEGGQEPGLRFAALLDGKGGCMPMNWQEVSRWRPEHGVLWIHLERDHPNAQDWVRTRSGIDPVFADVVLAEESRPRVEAVEDSLLIVLRGISRIAAGQESDLGIGVDLVPIHLWVDWQRVISLRDSDHQLGALRDIRNAHAVGKGPTRPGALLVQIADKVVKDLEPILDGMDEEVDRLDDLLMHRDSESGVRAALSDLRRRATHLRRYLSPQRDALNRLQHEEPSWLTGRDKVHLREVADKIQRFIEYLDAIRDRATILHEDLSALISERIAKTSNRLGAMAALLLPPSLIAGLMGMNVGGIPGSDDPYGFWKTVLVMAFVSLCVLVVLKCKRWL